jgi:phosphoribosylglycinamide formyltransferase 1
VTARLVVLASGSGSTLQAVLDAAADPEFGAEVVAAGTDRPGCAAMARAAAAGVATFAIPLADYADRAEWNATLAEAIAVHRPDLVLLAGFMRILDAATVSRFEMINTHPSLLPSFPGGHAVSDALAHGVKVTGVTVHRVDAGLDSGPILAQAAVPVLDGDTADTLRERIQAAEKPLFLDTIRRLCRRVPSPSAVGPSAVRP